ncbi:MAG: IscS subfamily cysteine desulfurase [Saprospirales bacterium]|nr:IscS subfamily cysteine desulfurase [Saprospirales bacterium]
MQERIYMDNNATTPCDPRVLEEMLPYFTQKFGNAASRSHTFGWEAEDAVDKARERIAAALGVLPKEIVFTSGATESDNLAIKGIFEAYASKGDHIITVKTEHKAVLDTCKALQKRGATVTYLNVDREGLIDLNELREAITDKTVLVAVMWANNETGVLQPMREIAAICEEKGVLLFSDATQAVGKIEVKPKEVGVHLLAFSGHKIYGPKGVGGLYVSSAQPRVKLSAQIHGGGHERGMRSGTLNVPGIVGLGAALQIATKEMEAEAGRVATLRDQLESGLLTIEEAFVNGSRTHRLPNVSNISFRCVEGEKLMATFNQKLAVSSGSACTSASLDPSHVLTAMGLSDEMAHSSIRFSLGRFNTAEDVNRAIELVKTGVEKLRKISPVWEMWKEGLLNDF